MSAPDLGLVLELPSGWRALEEHLIRYHGLERSYVEDMDSDTLRVAHNACHAAGQFAGGPHLHHVG